jgi:hypothetical protein
VNDPQRAPTRFVGVTLDEVRAAGTGLYEVTTTTGVPVRLHDMSLTRLAHDEAARTLVIEFLYDDPQWTPPEAETTPLAVLSFDDVEVVQQQGEPAAPETPPDELGSVQRFDFDERSGVFALSAYTTYWAFRASVATLRLRSASNRVGAVLFSAVVGSFPATLPRWRRRPDLSWTRRPWCCTSRTTAGRHGSRCVPS